MIRTVIAIVLLCVMATAACTVITMAWQWLSANIVPVTQQETRGNTTLIRTSESVAWWKAAAFFAVAFVSFIALLVSLVWAICCLDKWLG